jgi:hypothetical protein
MAPGPDTSEAASVETRSGAGPASTVVGFLAAAGRVKVGARETPCRK